MTSAPFLARLEASIERDPLYGCWLWIKATDKDGYGTIYRTGGPRRAHLEAYRELVGPIPPGMVLDHVCRRRNCCRPAHLDPVKGSENDLRRSWRFRSRMAKCKNGHSLATCITTPEGGRCCRVCQGPEGPLVAAEFANLDPAPAFKGIDRSSYPRSLGVVMRMPTTTAEESIEAWRIGSDFKP